MLNSRVVSTIGSAIYPPHKLAFSLTVVKTKVRLSPLHTYVSHISRFCDGIALILSQSCHSPVKQNLARLRGHWVRHIHVVDGINDHLPVFNLNTYRAGGWHEHYNGVVGGDGNNRSVTKDTCLPIGRCFSFLGIMK